MGTSCSEGEVSDGIIPQAVAQAFDTMAEQRLMGKDIFISVEMLEIYNEEVRDLLCHDSPAKPISLFERDGDVCAKGVKTVKVETAEDVLRFLRIAAAVRTTESTQMNSKSSRSHAIVSLLVCHQHPNGEGETLTRLNLVDLAGSERAADTAAVGDRLTEGSYINKSLLVLGKVIRALTSNDGHIPYRDSKLTRLLKRSLGGASKTCLLACVSPGDEKESLSTLKFASLARGVKNKQVQNPVTPRLDKTGDVKEEGVLQVGAEKDAAPAPAAATLLDFDHSGISQPVHIRLENCNQFGAEADLYLSELEEPSSLFEASRVMAHPVNKGVFRLAQTTWENPSKARSTTAVNGRTYLCLRHEQCSSAARWTYGATHGTLRRMKWDPDDSKQYFKLMSVRTIDTGQLCFSDVSPQAIELGVRYKLVCMREGTTIHAEKSFSTIAGQTCYHTTNWYDTDYSPDAQFTGRISQHPFVVFEHSVHDSVASADEHCDRHGDEPGARFGPFVCETQLLALSIAQLKFAMHHSGILDGGIEAESDSECIEKADLISAINLHRR
jgi:hypothetical protein